MENTLRVRRAERRLSQRMLAKRVGIGEDRYWRIENDYIEPTSAEMAALAHELGVPEDILFTTLSAHSERAS